jgi:hypothetical protein
MSSYGYVQHLDMKVAASTHKKLPQQGHKRLRGKTNSSYQNSSTTASVLQATAVRQKHEKGHLFKFQTESHVDQTTCSGDTGHRNLRKPGKDWMIEMDM